MIFARGTRLMSTTAVQNTRKRLRKVHTNIVRRFLAIAVRVVLVVPGAFLALWVAADALVALFEVAMRPTYMTIPVGLLLGFSWFLWVLWFRHYARRDRGL